MGEDPSINQADPEQILRSAILHLHYTHTVHMRVSPAKIVNVAGVVENDLCKYPWNCWVKKDGVNNHLIECYCNNLQQPVDLFSAALLCPR